MDINKLFRIGVGYDIHPLIEGRKCIIGGVEIPYEKGLEGHSDGDVLAHSIIDSLLGALSLGDIGGIFGVDKPEYKDVSSLNLLEKVYKLIEDNGYIVNNVDVTVLAQEPNLTEHIDKIRDAISKILKTNKDRVSVKATTAKGMGVVGEKKAIAAYSVASLINQLEAL